MSKIDHQIIECKNHIWPYIKKKSVRKNLEKCVKIAKCIVDWIMIMNYARDKNVLGFGLVMSI